MIILFKILGIGFVVALTAVVAMFYGLYKAGLLKDYGLDPKAPKKD